MGRKPNKKDLTISKYRWEFLRRNLAYKENYSEFKKGNLKTLDFCKKWRLLYAPLDPTKSFENIYKEAFNAFDKGNKLNKNQVKEYAEHWLSQTLLPNLMFGMPVDCIDRMGEDDFDFSFPLTEGFLNQGILKLQIDLNYSKSAILKSFERVLANYKELYESQSSPSLLETYKLRSKEKGMQKKDKEFYLKRIKELEGRIIKKGKSKKKIEQTKPISLSTKHFDKYDTYLRIWDMRDQFNPPAFKEIGKTIHSEKPIKKAGDLARKNFYAVYKLIYGKKYQYEDARKAKRNISKEHLAITCDKCPQKDACTDLCPQVIGFAEQDYGYQREMLKTDQKVNDIEIT